MKPTRTLVALCFVLVGVAEGRTVRLARDCDVWRDTGSTPVRACRIPRGTPLRAYERVTDTVVRITAAKCQGLVRMECLNIGRRAASEAQAAAEAQAEAELEADKPPLPTRPLRLGVELQVDAVSGAVSYSTKGSAGLGYGGNLGLEIPLGTPARIRLGLGYQSLQLKQSFDGSGALEDTPVDFNQRRAFLTSSLLLGFSFNSDVRLSARGPEWWLEGGAEYDHPLSATQTTAASTIDFKADDKLLLATGGIRADFTLKNGMGLDAFLRFYYNVGSQGGSSLYGFRFGGALNLGL